MAADFPRAPCSGPTHELPGSEHRKPEGNGTGGRRGSGQTEARSIGCCSFVGEKRVLKKLLGIGRLRSSALQQRVTHGSCESIDLLPRAFLRDRQDKAVLPLGEPARDRQTRIESLLA